MRLEWVRLVEAEVQLPTGGAGPVRSVVGALLRRNGSSGCEEEEEEGLVLHDQRPNDLTEEGATCPGRCSLWLKSSYVCSLPQTVAVCEMDSETPPAIVVIVI